MYCCRRYVGRLIINAQSRINQELRKIIEICRKQTKIHFFSYKPLSLISFNAATTYIHTLLTTGTKFFVVTEVCSCFLFDPRLHCLWGPSSGLGENMSHRVPSRMSTVDVGWRGTSTVWERGDCLWFMQLSCLLVWGLALSTIHSWVILRSLLMSWFI